MIALVKETSPGLTAGISYIHANNTYTTIKRMVVVVTSTLKNGVTAE